MAENFACICNFIIFFLHFTTHTDFRCQMEATQFFRNASMQNCNKVIQSASLICINLNCWWCPLAFCDQCRAKLSPPEVRRNLRKLQHAPQFQGGINMCSSIPLRHTVAQPMCFPLQGRHIPATPHSEEIRNEKGGGQFKIPAFLSATTNPTSHKRAHTHAITNSDLFNHPRCETIFFLNRFDPQRPTTCYNSGFRSQFTCSFDVHGPHSARNGSAANQHSQRKDPEDPNLMCHFQNRSRYVFLFHTCSILNIESQTLIL